MRLESSCAGPLSAGPEWRSAQTKKNQSNPQYHVCIVWDGWVDGMPCVPGIISPSGKLEPFHDSLPLRFPTRFHHQSYLADDLIIKLLWHDGVPAGRCHHFPCLRALACVGLGSGTTPEVEVQTKHLHPSSILVKVHACIISTDDETSASDFPPVCLIIICIVLHYGVLLHT